MVEVLGRGIVPKLEDSLSMIQEVLEENPRDRLYVIINNIDGPQLRTSKMQDFLSRLAAIPNLHLVASVDHINAPLRQYKMLFWLHFPVHLDNCFNFAVWDNVKRSRFNFFWCDATTFLPYRDETSYESSMLVDHGGALALASLESVFCSLTSNAQKMYILVVNYQLEHSKTAHYPGKANFEKKVHSISQELFIQRRVEFSNTPFTFYRRFSSSNFHKCNYATLLSTQLNHCFVFCFVN